ncbi:MAG: Hsp20/alpha crystallin family protein [Clostridiaceae bacterium]|nr:Hsp20/alpha crystallin family protein [Clostridiaceae bacterium]
MFTPSIFRENLLDDFFRSPFSSYTSNTADMMKTDVKEVDNNYEITMNLPGVKKEDVKAELKDGYLTINASSGSSTEEKDENGRYIRRERYSGSCSRSFYVGDQVTETDIRAKFENGTLKMTVPMKEEKEYVPEKKYITIEG